MLFITRSTLFAGFLLVSQVFALVPRAGDPCASDCAAYLQDSDCTTSTTCQCTATITNELQTCVNCIVDVGKANPAVITNEQQVISVFMGLCSGFNLPAITVASSVISATGTATAGGSSATGGVSATTTANTAKSSSASASGSGSQATSTAPSTSSSGQKSGAVSGHKPMAVGPHVVVGAVVAMILAV